MAKAKGFDLTKLEPAETATLNVTHPTTFADTGITVELYGMDSPQYQAAQRVIIDRRLEGMRKKKTLKDEHDGLELLASCTAGWENLQLEGADYPFSRDNAIELYRRFKWLREQVDAFIGDRAHFIKA